MRNVAAIALLLLGSSVAAQTSPKSVKTLRVEASPSHLFRVDDDGTVWVDWQRVEATAQAADLTNGDIARTLIAVRDGKARPEIR